MNDKPKVRRGVARVFASLLIMTSMSNYGADVAIDLDVTKTNDLEIKALPDGGYDIKTTGHDPFVITKPKGSYDPNKQHVFAFDYFCEKGLANVQLFYGPPIAENRSAVGPAVLSSEGWTSYAFDIKQRQKDNSWRGGFREFRIDLGNQPGKTIQLRNVRLREPTAAERRKALKSGSKKERVAAFDASLKAMADTTYDAAITGIEATETTMKVTIDAGKTTDALMLCEVPIYQSVVGRKTFVWKQALPTKPGVQTVEIDRVRDGHDRVFSSWILMLNTDKGLVPVSHQRFVDVMPAKWKLTRDKPKTKKGTVSLNAGNALLKDDYAKLGVDSATKNILLPALIGPKPSKDTVPHTFNGITVHVNQKALAGLDQSMLAMERFGTVVSVIILIPKNTPMSHPDCDPAGIYAMANVVEKNGWTIYAAGLDFLAQRYMRPDKKYGRITHWILHNEVDAGWVWTNAGEIPADTYLDLYYRSMRTAQSVIRRYGNAGQVLMSLTHYWTTRHNKKCYPPKTLIDILAKRSDLEGNFDWGLAYHPYPQNLRDPRTWLDKKITFDFNTPLITPKNLEVLDAYMKQKAMLYAGTVRTIVLSEQGSNSNGHTANAYRDQAAGLVYTWLKMQSLDSIESYVHHRWMDHPQEGGLNLGFRRRSQTSTATAKKATATVCEELAKFGIKSTLDETKKPAWEVFRLLETADQDKVVKWAKTVIPAKYFDEIPAKVKLP